MPQAVKAPLPDPADEVILEVQGMRKRWPNGRQVLDGTALQEGVTQPAGQDPVRGRER